MPGCLHHVFLVAKPSEIGDPCCCSATAGNLMTMPSTMAITKSLPKVSAPFLWSSRLLGYEHYNRRGSMASCAAIAAATHTPVNAMPMPKGAIFNSLVMSFKSPCSPGVSIRVNCISALCLPPFASQRFVSPQGCPSG
eukprot:3291307-Amphidinium_carterae.1